MKVDLVMSVEVGCASRAIRSTRPRDHVSDCGSSHRRGRESGRLVGVVTDRDICVAAYMKGRPLPAIPIAEVMAKRVVPCRASDDLQAEEAMRKAQVHCRSPMRPAPGRSPVAGGHRPRDGRGRTPEVTPRGRRDARGDQNRARSRRRRAKTKCRIAFREAMAGSSEAGGAAPNLRRWTTISARRFC